MTQSSGDDMRRVRRKRNQGEEGYTLLWVLMLGVVMVTLVSAAMFASSYVMGTGVHGLQTETVGHLTSDTEIQNDLSNIEQIITDTATKEQSELTDADGVSKVTGDAAQQLDAQGYTATITDSYTDSSGTIHEVVRVSKGGSSITLDVTFQSSGSGSTTSTVPVRQTQNPYPYSQYSSEYVADGNATTQAQVDAAEETKAGALYRDPLQYTGRQSDGFELEQRHHDLWRRRGGYEGVGHGQCRCEQWGDVDGPRIA